MADIDIEYTWPERFTMTGRPPDSKQEWGWEVVLGVMINGKPFYSDPLTPEQAEAKGFPLSRIVKGINDAALKQADASASAKKEAETKVAQAIADRDEAVAARLGAAEAAHSAFETAKATAENEREAATEAWMKIRPVEAEKPQAAAVEQAKK